MKKMSDSLIHHTDLLEFSKQLMIEMGASEDDAFHVADNLVTSKLR